MSAEKFPLAFDDDGNPIPIPVEAVAWRVKRITRGRPRNVIDRVTGRRLEIPLTADLDTLVDAGCPPDDYRLEAIDRDGQAIPGVVAICHIDDDEDEKQELVDPTAANFAQMAQLLRDTVNANNQALSTLTAFVNNLRPIPAPIHVEIPQPVMQAPSTGSPNEWVQALAPIVGPIVQMIASAIMSKGAAPQTPPASGGAA